MSIFVSISLGAATGVASMVFGASLAANLVGMAVADRAWRYGLQEEFAREHRDGRSSMVPPTTVLFPMTGIEEFSRECLEATLDMCRCGGADLIVCVQSPDDPVIPLAHEVLAARGWSHARVMIGYDPITGNPKVNNIAKGWRASDSQFVLILDGNARPPIHFLETMHDMMTPDVGAVSSMPLGIEPRGFWAHVELAFLNTHQARWQYCADYLGSGFAQGKAILWRRSVLDQSGGLRELGIDAAEDAATTKIVRRRGMRVALVDFPVPQPIGQRTPSQVWSRQLRWSILRRHSFAEWYALEPLAGGLGPCLALWALLSLMGVSSLWPVLVTAALLYGSELWMGRRAGMVVSAASLPAMIVRDSLILPMWCIGWFRRDFLWRGVSQTTA